MLKVAFHLFRLEQLLELLSTSCAKNPSTVFVGSTLKLNLYGFNVFNLVIPSDIATAFSFNLII